eukprot:6351251-Prymnesium_polylepis.3
MAPHGAIASTTTLPCTSANALPTAMAPELVPPVMTHAPTACTASASPSLKLANTWSLTLKSCAPLMTDMVTCGLGSRHPSSSSMFSSRRPVVRWATCTKGEGADCSPKLSTP